MANRIYRVTEQLDENSICEYLVRAVSQGAAVKHVVENRYECEAVKQDDLVRLMEAGVKVVEAGAE